MLCMHSQLVSENNFTEASGRIARLVATQRGPSSNVFCTIVKSCLLLRGAIWRCEAAGAAILVDCRAQDCTKGCSIFSAVHAKAKNHTALSSDVPAQVPVKASGMLLEGSLLLCDACQT